MLLVPLDITLVTSSNSQAGTAAQVYMGIRDSEGTQTTFSLPKPLSAGSVETFQASYVTGKDLSEIRLRTYSSDAWQFDAIYITFRGTEYSFFNPTGMLIDALSGQVVLTP